MREQVWEMDNDRAWNDMAYRDRMCRWLLSNGVHPSLIPASDPLYVTRDTDAHDDLVLHGTAIVPPEGAEPTQGGEFGPIWPSQVRPGTDEVLKEQKTWPVTSLPPVD